MNVLVGVSLALTLLGPGVAWADHVPAATRVVEDFSAEVVGSDPLSFSTPTGFWTVASDGGKPVLLEDGSRWEDSRMATLLADQARALYGDRWAEFIDDLTETGYFPMAIFNRIDNFSEGTISMRFMVVAGNIDQDCGILFNYRPNGDYMALRSDTQENNLLLYRWLQGQPASMKRVGDVPTTLREWHEQTLVVSGQRITGLLDGRPGLELDLDAPVAGKVGLWSKTDTVVMFDRFTVEPGVVSVAPGPNAAGQPLQIRTTNLKEAVDWARLGNLKGAHSEFVQFLGDWDAVKDRVREQSPDGAAAIEAAIGEVRAVLLDPTRPAPDQATYLPLLEILQKRVQDEQAKISL